VSDADYTRDEGLTTEQIASARPGSAQPAEEAAARDQYDAGQYNDAPAGQYNDADDRSAPRGADPATSGTARGDAPDAVPSGSTAPGGNTAPGPERHASLLDDSELQSITMRWKDIQAEFVDEPSKAVQEADALVAELMQRLAQMFATERAELEGRWQGGSEVGTEELRQGLRLYRSFFERLLAA
jgi:hypothetical protein